ncbi:MAG TPA: patatin-like phospholipase family protein [Pseudonocardia sp.]|jgi:NTE family protein
MSGEIVPRPSAPGRPSAHEVAERARRVAEDARQLADREPYTGNGPRGLRDPVARFREGPALDPRTQPIAIVLAGGGARGAYQAGVVRFLAEIGTPISALSGASIGALNAAILAAAPSLTEGARRLVELWSQVARTVAESPFGTGALSDSTLTQYLNLPHHLTSPVLRPGFLEDLLLANVDVQALRAGPPLWVSTFPAVDLDFGMLLRGFVPGAARIGPLRAEEGLRLGWAVDVVRGMVFKEPSTWIKVNDLPPEAMHDAILSSAALPLVLPPRSVGGKLYRDGGLGDNVPVGALCRQAGCRRVVVVHLESLPLLNPNHYPELDIVEVIPSKPVSPDVPLGWLASLLDMSPRRIAELAELGYADARQQLGDHWRREAAAQVCTFLDGFRHDAVAELDEPRDR